MNGSLLKCSGIIGRREFFINTLYSLMFSLPFFTIAIALVFFFSKIEDSVIGLFTFFTVYLIGIVIFCALLIPNIIKRLNDINGCVKQKLNTSCITLYTIASIFISIIPELCILTTGFLLFLQIKKGKISSEIPHDITKEFNWGAYFGTWLWGLINKSYNTLWMIPIALTPMGFVYSLICGMRGNEWAAEKRDWSSEESFKQSQEKQTIGFVIWYVLVLPLIITALSMVLIGFFIFKDIDNPKQFESKMEKVNTAMNYMATLYFDSYEITPEENKFYIQPSDWKYTSFKKRTDMLDFAATISSEERRKTSTGNKHFSKSTELPRTKIYNVEDKKLLAEFYMDETVFSQEKPNIKEIFKSSISAYKFYEPVKNKKKDG